MKSFVGAFKHNQTLKFVSTHLNPTAFSTIRCSIGIALRIKRPTEECNAQHEDLMKRTAALTLQTSVLNSLSLLISGVTAFLSFLSSALRIVKFFDSANMFLQIYRAYFIIPQYFVVICSSNIVFIVHCYYSKLYREAMWETFAAVETGWKQCFGYVCRCKPKANAVHPEEKF